MRPRHTLFSCWKRIALLCLLLCSGAANDTYGAEEKNVKNVTVFIGTYTGGDSKGIYSLRLDLANGDLQSLAVTEGVKNPSFVAVHPQGEFLYSVSEVDDYAKQNTGAVSAFSITPNTGRLTLLNHASSGGAGPCHLVVDATGKHVLVANYGGGSVASIPIGTDGQVGPPTTFIQHQGSSVNPRRQAGPHAHSINLDGRNRFAFAADLGLDKVLVYRFEAASGKMEPHTFPYAAVQPGAGPRHLAIHPTNRYAYVINELSCTVTAFSLDADAGLSRTFSRFRRCHQARRSSKVIPRRKSRPILRVDSCMALIGDTIQSSCTELMRRQAC